MKLRAALKLRRLDLSFFEKIYISPSVSAENFTFLYCGFLFMGLILFLFLCCKS